MVSKNSKTWQTVCFLKGQFAAGAFSGGLLPKETVLASELNISRNTLRAAMTLLENEGLIIRKRHAGTRWRESSALNASPHPSIGLLARTTGHVFSEFYQNILTELAKRGLSIQVVSTDGIDGYSRYPIALNKNICRLLNAGPSALLIDGYCFNKLPNTDLLLAQHPIFFDFLDDSKPKQPIVGVWLNYEKAGYLGGSYLISQGCRCPLFIPSRLPYSTRMDPEIYEHHRERQFLTGYSRALQEHGLDPLCYVIDPLHTPKSLEMLFYNLLENTAIRPDGIFASRDYLIISFLKIAAELKIDTKAIKFVGGGNTPWSMEESLHPFTSINFHYDQCAKKLVEQALLQPEQRKNIFIEPELLER